MAASQIADLSSMAFGRDKSAGSGARQGSPRRLAPLERTYVIGVLQGVLAEVTRDRIFGCPKPPKTADLKPGILILVSQTPNPKLEMLSVRMTVTCETSLRLGDSLGCARNPGILNPDFNLKPLSKLTCACWMSTSTSLGRRWIASDLCPATSSKS